MKKYMKKWLLKITIKVAYWLMFKHGTPLNAYILTCAGWEYDDVTKCWVEPNIKKRDKVWIQLEHHYYRVYHGEERTFIALENSVQWLQLYLFTLDKHSVVESRHLLV